MTAPKRGRPKSGEPPRTVLAAKVTIAQHADICRRASAERLTVSAYVTRALARVIANSGKR